MKNLIKLTYVIILIISVISCNDDTTDEGGGEDPLREFGISGTHEVSTLTDANDIYTTIYYPSDIATMEEKSPLVFFISGWFSDPQESTTYKTLLEFIASHGYTVIYTYEGSTTNYQHCIDGFEGILTGGNVTMTNNIIPYLDFSKIGAIGHSAGGSLTFKVLEYYKTQRNYGGSGRFIMTLDTWYAFGMSEDALKNYYNNTNVVFIKFGEGGNNAADGTDARIPLTQYYLLESIADTQKDYQIYDLENADHTYPKGDGPVSSMQGILKPLDALMEYTFKNQDEEIRVIALENGNDDPYADDNGIQVVYPKADYPYPCDGANTLIDYCSMFP